MTDGITNFFSKGEFKWMGHIRTFCHIASLLMDLLYAKWYSMSTYLVLKTRLYIYDNLFWIEKAEAFIFFKC